jgi:hypothetical protein
VAQPAGAMITGPRTKTHSTTVKQVTEKPEHLNPRCWDQSVNKRLMELTFLWGDGLHCTIPGWGNCPEVEYLLSMCETLGSILSEKRSANKVSPEKGSEL